MLSSRFLNTSDRASTVYCLLSFRLVIQPETRQRSN